MATPLCNKSLQHFSETEHLHSTLIVNCCLNGVLCFTTITANSLTIYGLRKAATLSKPLKTLLLSLTVSDLAVGLLGQPLYIALIVKTLAGKYSYPRCSTTSAFILIVAVLSSASFLNDLAIGVDRLMAVHFHLRYRHFVTQKRVCIAIVAIWSTSVLSQLTLIWLDTDIIALAYGVAGLICLTATSLIYLKIYVVVRRHRKAITRQEKLAARAQSGEMAQAPGAKKSAAISAFYVYLLLLICYLPHSCSMTAITLYGPTVTRRTLFFYTQTLLFLNSSLNPIIYCWKMRNVRQAMIAAIRKLLRIEKD